MFIAKQFAKLETVDGVIAEWFAVMRAKGVAMAGYHITPPLASPTGGTVIVRQFGFPPEFAEIYDDPLFRAMDPVAGIAFEAGRPILWSGLYKMGRLTDDQKQFVAVCNRHGLVDGVSMPLYGPNGREGYLSYSLGRPFGETDYELAIEVQTIAQAAHIRVAQLMEAEFLGQAKLSGREKTVLQWLARGKSTPDVATIMGLAPDTIDTYTRRIYAKLGVNDRVAAIVVGLTHGLVKF